MTKRALISVSDKTGVTPFAAGLVANGFEIISTGGTRTVLEEAGVPTLAIDDITGFPEMLDGRVKRYIRISMADFWQKGETKRIKKH